MPTFSKRLSVIASLVPVGARVCDVGTDHGYLSIELKKSGVAESVIATDINPKPLGNAEKNIKAAKVEGIELRLCDGLSGIEPGEADTAVIAGMGGEVISGIIYRGEAVAKSGITLILQPTTSPEYLRRFLCENGYEIEKEIPVFENGKLYSVMLCRYTGRVAVREEYYYYIGALNCETQEGRRYIEKQYNRCFSCMSALEGVVSKGAEYNLYKQICRDLENVLNGG